MNFLDIKTKNAGTLDYVPKNLNEELEKAFDIANEANFSEQELELQHRKKDWAAMSGAAMNRAIKIIMAQFFGRIAIM